MTVDLIRDQVRKCLYELETDSRLVRAGLKTEAQSAAILERYRDLQSLRTLDFLLQVQEQTQIPRERERSRRLYYTCLSLHLYGHVAPLSDSLDTRLAQTEVLMDGNPVNYFDLPILIEREESAIVREDLDRQRLQVVEDTNDVRLQMLREVLACLQEHLHHSSYLEYCRAKKKVDYGKLAAALEPAISKLEGLYRKHMGNWLARHDLGELGRIPECHVHYLLALRPLDKGGTLPLERIVGGALQAIGLPLSSFPNIHLDPQERPQKNPRACCYSLSVPDEIHLITKPTGSLVDFNTFLHESGHAFHYACTGADLDFEFKKLAPSYALTETYAFLLQKLSCEPAWLEAFLGVDRRDTRTISYYTILSDLYLFMRYTAKFSYETGLFGQASGSLAAARNLYQETLTNRTGFLFSPADYLNDVDEELYSADYLRAWIGERQLAQHLRRELGENWPCRAQTGSVLKALWSRGDQEEVEDLLGSLGFAPWDAEPLISWYRDSLEG
ncbi:MAG: hypothetical protein HYY65_08140 [Candidatus Tectomicrobia bacterium]|uniref:Peptidase M3A/M3B catalytic domain-containing protein n=1 Tax=Tectimicrobiota bacterium TaxID=2528274 RepID=A0A932M0E1_UNCTE|nr:hypothetical protein [Candidatus Tectomicrobia bacterium]